MTTKQSVLVPLDFAEELTLIGMTWVGEIQGSPDFKWFDHTVSCADHKTWAALAPMPADDVDLILNLAEGFWPVLTHQS